MYRAGMWLIYAGVVLHALRQYAGLPAHDQAAALLALYGLLLLVEPLLGERNPGRSDRLPLVETAEGGAARRRLAAGTLGLQTGLAVALLHLPPHVELSGGLFIPLSLQAVLFFGPRPGFLCLAIFPLAMFGSLASSEKGWPFALAVSLLGGGLFVLSGICGHQVRNAQRARREHRHMLAELEAANSQLQGYAAQVEELAAEQECSRRAREVHDSVTQTVLNMDLAVHRAGLLLDSEPDRVTEHLQRLEDLAAGVRGEIRALTSVRPREIGRSLAIDSRRGLSTPLSVRRNAPEERP